MSLPHLSLLSLFPSFLPPSLSLQGSLAEQGRVLRVGILTVVDGFSKHKRKVFLFEQCLIFAKIKRTTKTGPTGTEEYEFRNFYRVSSLENNNYVTKSLFYLFIMHVDQCCCSTGEYSWSRNTVCSGDEKDHSWTPGSYIIGCTILCLSSGAHNEKGGSTPNSTCRKFSLYGQC